MILNSPIISGSLTVTGNIISSGSITLSGSVASASFAANAATASFVTLAQTASFVANAQSASNAVAAQTASYANALTVAGTLTAQTLVVQTITSSVDFVTGSTRFGSILGNTHVFTGSVTMNPNGLFVSSSGVVGIGTSTILNKLDVNQSGSSANPVFGVGLKVYADAGNDASIAISQTARGTAVIGMAATGSAPADMVIGNDVIGNIIFKQSMTINNLSSGTERFRINATGAAIFSSSVDGTIFNSTSNAFRFSGSNALSLVSLNSQNVVKINAAGYWGVQLVGANDQGILINNTGIVGIGTTDPSTGFAGTIANVRLALRNGTPGASGGTSVLLIGGDNNHYSSITGEHSGGGQTSLAFGTSASVQNPTERMRITSGGVVNIGLTSGINLGERFNVIAYSLSQPTLSRFFVNVSGALSTSAARFDKFDNNSTTSQVFLDFTINNQQVANGSITANGASQVTFTSWSDRRLKENITNLPSQLSNIMALRPVEFDYKDGSGHQIGFIAQEVQEVYSDIVGENAEGYLTISGLGKMESRLIKAIQELKAQNDDLQSQINELKAQ
jgi:hypothetical protein